MFAWSGEHVVDVSFAGQPLGQSPYTVGAMPGHDASRCKAYGPGLESAVTNKPAVFTVETKGAGKGGLGLAIEGPSEAAMECTDNKDGSCTVQYLPTVPGDYEVHITFADDPIPGTVYSLVWRWIIDQLSWLYLELAHGFEYFKY